MSKRGFVAFSLLVFVASNCPIGSLAWSDAPPPDTIELRGGGQVEGKVLRRVDTPQGGYVSIQVDEGISVAVEQARVARVRTSDDLAEYAAKAAEAGDDPEKHYELGRWCTGNHLPQQRLFHYQRAITLNPEHNLARAALDYVRDERGNWIPYALQQRNRGLVWASGGWQFPEAVAKSQMQTDANIEASKWTKTIAKLRSQFLGRGKKQQEAYQAIQAIKDPLAAGAIAEELLKSRGNSSQPRGLRLVWIKLLGQFRTTESVKALVIAGIDEPDSVVREAALSELKEYGWQSAIATYVPMLKSSSNLQVRSALRALTYFPDPSLAMTYVDALVTTHLQAKSNAPGISAGFGETGGSSFSTGSDNKPIPVAFKNTDAVT
ncbi:MAG: HEAT repeat domain-containing protein, partial [Pirellulaceae bacterium]